MMSIIENIDFTLERDVLTGQFGIDVEDEEDVLIFDYLFNETLRVGNPKIVYKESVIERNSAGSVVIDGVEFVSQALSRNLSGVSRCFPYVVTCGCEIDEIVLDDESPFIEYWRDEIKARLLMAARRSLNKAVKEEFGITEIASMAPGSADADVWLVEEQSKLFSVLGDECGEIGVELTESCLMIPNKSLSGIIFESYKDFLSCQLCKREDCPDRKTGFDQSLYEIMHKK